MLIGSIVGAGRHLVGPAKIPVTTKSPEALAQYQKGLTFFENAHTAEGVEALKQALALDPEFATAKALKAIVTSGDEGLKEADAALAASIFHYAEHSVADLKHHLREHGISVRM